MNNYTLTEKTLNIIKENGGVIERTFCGYSVVYFDCDVEEIYNIAGAVYTDNNVPMIVTGRRFKEFSEDIQLYTLWHEVGHIVHGHTKATDDGTNEYQADMYAVEHLDSKTAIDGLNAVKRILDEIIVDVDKKASLMRSMDLRISYISDHATGQEEAMVTR